MRPAYGFGLSQEDPRTEASALGLPGGRLLSVTSAGDMALSLLALGADEVVAVDIDPAQNHLARLKLAAVTTLARSEAIRFLGYLPADASRRAAWLTPVLEQLPGPARAFWREHRAQALSGAIWAGRFERFVGRALTLLGPWLRPRFERLFACRTLDEQVVTFARDFDRPLLRRAFHVAFHPRVYARRGIDPTALRHYDPSTPLGDRFFERFRAMCTATLARDNPLLHLQALRRVMSEDAVPAFLTADGVEVLRARRDGVSFATADLASYLQARPAGTFDRFHLSNVTDWLDGPSFDELLRTLAWRADRPARLVWRFIHVDRDPPDDLRGVVRADRARGAELQRVDCFPIYTIVPATVEAAGPRGTS